MKNPLRLLLILCIACPGCSLMPSTYQTKQYQPIHSAAEGGDLPALEELLKQDPKSLNLKTWGGDTPLHLAAGHGHAEAVKLLMDRGADVSAVNQDRQTPLHLAAQFGFKPVVELLLSKNAELNPRDKFGLTPLGRATAWHHPDMAEFLRQQGGHE